MINNNTQSLVTGKVRLSYVHLFTPYTSHQGGELKYSTTILLPKADTATKQSIDIAIHAAIMEGLCSKWGGAQPEVVALPIYDGDGLRPSDGMPYGEECKGHWVFQASSRQAPDIVDLSLQRIVNHAEIYSGVYARVQVRFYPYLSNGKKGIGCGLGPVQKLGDGEVLGGRISAAAAFGDKGTVSGFTPIGEVLHSIIGSQAFDPITGEQVHNSIARIPVMDPATGAPVSDGAMRI